MVGASPWRPEGVVAHGPAWQGQQVTSSCKGRTGSRSGRGQGSHSRRRGTAASGGTLDGGREGRDYYRVVEMEWGVVVENESSVAVLW